jgi:hypothetical protein
MRRRKAIPIPITGDGPWPAIVDISTPEAAKAGWSTRGHAVLAGRFDPGWAYLMWLELQASVWVVSGVHLFPEPHDWKQRAPGVPLLKAPPRSHHGPIPPGGLTARGLRRLQFRGVELMNQLIAGAREIADAYTNPPPTGSALERRAQIAAAYVDALKASGKPLHTVATRFGMTTTSVRDAVYRARKDGLLTAPPRVSHQGVRGGELGKGVRGGELTQTAIDLLEHHAPAKSVQKGRRRSRQRAVR